LIRKYPKKNHTFCKTVNKITITDYRQVLMKQSHSNNTTQLINSSST